MSEHSNALVATVLAAIVIAASLAAVELSGFYASTGRPAENGSTTGSNGIRLSVSINATQIKAGQSLQVNVSLFNTLSKSNNLTWSNDWPFQGIYLPLWPPCYSSEFIGANSPTPSQAVVLKGDYTNANISSVANIHFEYGPCHEGVNVDNVVFEPESSQARVVGTAYGLMYGAVDGPFKVSSTFTTNGYWDLISNSQRSTPPFLSYAPSPQSGQTPAAPTTTPFVPGTYTVAVADEWGQDVILHLSVEA